MRHLLVRLVLGLAVLGSLSVPLAAQAATPPSWSLQPTATPGEGQAARPYFLFNVTPGEQVSDSATLYNPTQAALHLRLFVSDAYNTVRGGGFCSTPPRSPTRTQVTGSSCRSPSSTSRR